MTQAPALTGTFPMRYLGPAGGHPKQLTEKEWREFRALRAEYVSMNRDYDSGWNRPSLDAAVAIWSRVAERMRGPVTGRALSIDDLMPDIRTHPWLTAEDDFSIAPHPMQALAVAIDAVTAGAEVRLDKQGNAIGRTFTTNDVFDAIAGGWSDNYRKARGTARSSWEMSRETLMSSWRDLQRLGVQFEPLLRTVQQGCPGLYTTRHNRRNYDAMRLSPSPARRAASRPAMPVVSQRFPSAARPQTTGDPACPVQGTSPKPARGALNSRRPARPRCAPARCRRT